MADSRKPPSGRVIAALTSLALVALAVGLVFANTTKQVVTGLAGAAILLTFLAVALVTRRRRER